MFIVAEAEITIDVSAEVETDHGELCGDPPVIVVAGVPFSRGSNFYDVIMWLCRSDLEADIAEKLRSNDIKRKCRQWGGSI